MRSDKAELALGGLVVGDGLPAAVILVILHTGRELVGVLIFETCVNLTRKTCIHVEIDSGLNSDSHGNATCHEDESELGELGKLDVLILLGNLYLAVQAELHLGSYCHLTVDTTFEVFGIQVERDQGLLHF